MFNYLYLPSFYLIFLVFLVVAVVIAEVSHYLAVTVLINGSGSFRLDNFSKVTFPRTLNDERKQRSKA